MSELLQAIDKEVPADLRFPRLFQVTSMAPVAATEEIGVPMDALGRRMISWVHHKPHPLLAEFTIVRMFKRADGLKIYSVSNDGKKAMLNFLPSGQVLGVSYFMEPPVLLDELAACEAGEDEGHDDDDDDDPDEPDAPEQGDAPAATNGQATTS